MSAAVVTFVCTGGGQHPKRRLLSATVLGDGFVLLGVSGPHRASAADFAATERIGTWDNAELVCPKCRRNVRRSAQSVQELAAAAVAAGVSSVDIATLG